MSELSQLKSSALTFDSDDPASAWSTSSKAIEQWVGSLKHGAALIAFLDLVLERSTTARDSALVPSFLLGGPWGSPNVPSGEVSNDDASSPLKTRGAASGHNVPVTPLTPIYRFQSYTELPQESQQLDLQLLPYLQSIVRGSKAVLLEHLAQPLFTQGMVMLHKHFEADSCTKITAAFSLGRELRFSGDTKQYQIQVYTFIQTLLESKATMCDYMLACIMDSELPTAVKYGIAQDINDSNASEINYMVAWLRRSTTLTL